MGTKALLQAGAGDQSYEGNGARIQRRYAASILAPCTFGINKPHIYASKPDSAAPIAVA